jgi:hypothetical protein
MSGADEDATATSNDRLGNAVAFLSHSQARPHSLNLLWLERGRGSCCACV